MQYIQTQPDATITLSVDLPLSDADLDGSPRPYRLPFNNLACEGAQLRLRLCRK